MTGAQEVGLRPCPFCGGAARPNPRKCDVRGAGRMTQFLRVVCGRCHAIGPKLPTKAEAIAAWNTRAQETDHD